MRKPQTAKETKQIAKESNKSIEQILKEQPEMYWRLLLRSTGGRILGRNKTLLRGVFFTPFYVKNGFAYGLSRWYGENNKSIEVSSVRADLKKWSFVRKVPIIPSNDERRINLERQMRKYNKVINQIGTAVK
jgi:hypothetical protein